ncbi:MAG: Ig-like domain-containing protein, partial [Desulfobacterales bacterium]|nr:Ig-like domain-containing protein [Desulfobacterales bacterium]
GTLNASNGGGVTLGGDGTGTLTLTGTIADINTFLGTASNIQYTGAANIAGNDATTLAVSINDQEGSGNVSLGTVNIDITAVNDAPSLSGVPASVTFTEDQQGNLDLSAISLSDVDSTGSNFTLTIAAGSGTLVASSSGSVTISGSNSSTLTLTGTASDIDTYLNTASNIQYTGATNNAGTNADTITITADDQAGANNTTIGTVNVNITNINDNPTAIGLPTNVTVMEDVTSNVDLSALSLADVDSTDPDFTLTLVAGAGNFTANSGSGVTVSGSGSNNLTLTGTVSDIDLFLNSASNIQYTGLSNVHGNNADTISMSMDDHDGSGSLNLGIVNVDITAVNDAPVNTGTVVPTLSFTEDLAGNVNLSAMTLSDVDTTGNVILTLGVDTGTLSAVSGGGVSIAGAGTSTLTLTGNIGAIDTFLNTATNVQYKGALNHSGNNAASLTLTINDQEGSGNVNLGVVNLDIAHVNDPPTGTDNTISLNVGDSHTFAAADFGFADVDGDTLDRVKIHSQTLAAGTLTLNGVTVNDGDWIPAANISQLVYTANGDATDSFTFIVEDNNGLPDNQHRTLTLTKVSQPSQPVLPTHIYEPTNSPPPTSPQNAPQQASPPSQTLPTTEPTGTEATPLPQTESITLQPPQQPTPPAEPGNTGTLPGNGVQPALITRETIEVDAQGNVTFSSGNDGRQGGLQISSMEIDTQTNALQMIIQTSSGQVANNISVSLPDGSPLPTWLEYDPTLGRISGRPPQGMESITIKIISTNEQGETVILEVEINFNEGDAPIEIPDSETNAGMTNDAPSSPSPGGTLPLTEQIQQARTVPEGYGDRLKDALS